ncbi:MAG: dephospho-CoA kinase [Planctomycetes bacterium]|nr:dephospho-CoA kinase [Planctomycetota bacterium]
MILIGVAGGIASGKSLVSEQLIRLGAEVLDADRAGHDVLRDPEVTEAIRRRWGDDVFDAAGEIDRSEVAKIVFAPPPAGPEELTYLEQLTHPRIGQRLRERMAALARGRQSLVAVLDAPVMFKAGWDKMCDKVLFVDATRELRLARAKSRGWSEAEFDAREAAQESLDVKRSRADVIIDNSSSPEHTYAQVERFWRSLEE